MGIGCISPFFPIPESDPGATYTTNTTDRFLSAPSIPFPGKPQTHFKQTNKLVRSGQHFFLLDLFRTFPDLPEKKVPEKELLSRE